MSGEAVEELRDPLPTPLSWVVAIIASFFIFLLSLFTRYLAPGYYWLVQGWWIPLIYVIIILEILRKAGFEVSPAQLALLTIPMFMFGSKAWYTTFTGETNLFNTIPMWFHSFTRQALYVETLRPYYLESGLPDWLVPKDVDAVITMWHGLSAGQGIPWGVWIGPITAYSIFFIIQILIFAYTVYLLTGPQWIEMERIVYPNTAPTVYQIVTWGKRDEQGKSQLFNLRVTTTKIFWICVIIGLIIGLPSYGNVIAPFYWMQYIYGGYGGGLCLFVFDPTLMTRSILPGWGAKSYFYLGSALWFVLCPWDTLISIIIVYFVFAGLLPFILVKAGLVTYSPGMESFPYSSIGTQQPFPYMLLSIGTTFGLGFWYLWQMRGRFRLMADALSGKRIIHRGLNIRNATIIYIILIIVWLVWWIAAGLNPIQAILGFIIYMAFCLAAGRVWGEYGPWPLACTSNVWEWIWPIGAAVGAYSWTPPNTSVAAYAAGIFSAAYSSCLSWNNDPTSIGGTGAMYKVLYENKVHMGKALAYYTIFIVLMVPIYLVLDVYLSYHMGYVNLGPQGTLTPWNHASIALDRGIRALSYPGGFDINYYMSWTLAGAVLGIILAWMRATFAWFIFNPVFFAAMDALHWWWVQAIVAAIIKLVLTRALGAKRAEEFILPIVAGILTGAGLPYIIAGIYAWANGVLPNVATNWR